MELTLVPTTSLYLSNDRCIVEITLTNVSSDTVLVNKRLSIGYERSISRELYLKIYDEASCQLVSSPALDYDRPDAGKDEFIYLKPLECITTTVDICKWYKINLEKGRHELCVKAYYEANEHYNPSVPEEVIDGVFESAPTKIIWEQK